MAALDRAVAALVYASAALGVVFLAVAYGLIPGWLFYSIMGGEFAWIVCAVATVRRASWAPYLALVLALVTLSVSLPQPAHYTFAENGQLVAFAIFAGGSALEVALIVAVALRFVKGRGRGISSEALRP